MKYRFFEEIISPERMKRYLNACGEDRRKSKVLYRYNLSLSGAMLKIISCFEVALRNMINRTMILSYGEDWLRDCCLPGGMFDSPKTAGSQKRIFETYNKLKAKGEYTHTHLLSEMKFGIWKYMYTRPQYKATGQILLNVFPLRPKSKPGLQIGNKYIYNELDKVNRLRNRIAHHEPICFLVKQPVVSVSYALQEYQRIKKLLSWMGIDDKSLLFGIDNIESICEKILAI